MAHKSAKMVFVVVLLKVRLFCVTLKFVRMGIVIPPMAQPREALLELSYNGINATGDFSSKSESFSYTDIASGVTLKFVRMGIVIPPMAAVSG